MSIIQPSSWGARVTPPKPIELPEYKPHKAEAIADQVQTRRKQYAAAAASLQAELRRAEDAMMAALDEQDRREANRARNRDRIAKLAQENR